LAVNPSPCTYSLIKLLNKQALIRSLIPLEAMKISTTYVAGQCNIGGYEVLRRRIAGYIGSALTILWVLLSHLVHPLSQYRFLVIIPAMVAAVGFLQARKRFCVAYGLGGVENAEGQVADKVAEAAHRHADRRQAVRLLLQAALIGALVTALNLI
jgi:hypothetical protein